MLLHRRTLSVIQTCVPDYTLEQGRPLPIGCVVLSPQHQTRALSLLLPFLEQGGGLLARVIGFFTAHGRDTLMSGMQRGLSKPDISK
jgi:hypothetical protein